MGEDGIFLGVTGSTGEMIVGDEKGVWRTRTIRRKPEGERWSRENLEKIGWGAMGDDEGKTRRWRGDEDGGDDHGQGVQREDEGGRT